MSSPLGTAVRMPSEKSLRKVITAYFTYTSAGATTAITVTLDNDYPPIDLTIQSPILGILCIADETAVAVNDIQIFLPTGQMARGTAPDSAGEYQITGARTFKIYNTPDKNGKGIVSYVPKGSSQLT